MLTVIIVPVVITLKVKVLQVSKQCFSIYGSAFRYLLDT